MQRFPIVGRHHFYCIPGTAIKKCAIRSFADAFLAADAEIGIYFDAAEWWMILVGYPEHARFDRAILDACRRTSTTSAAVGSDRQYARLFFASGFAVAFRHGPLFFDDIVHIRGQRSEVRGQKSEVRGQKFENFKIRTETLGTI